MGSIIDIYFDIAFFTIFVGENESENSELAFPMFLGLFF